MWTYERWWLAWCLAFVAFACSSGGAATRPDPLAGEGLGGPPREVPKANDLVRQGEERLQQGDSAGAKQLFEQAIESDPNDARAHLDLGLACEMQQDVSGAEAAYRRAVELQPDLAEALNNLAVLLRARGANDEAVELLRKAVAANPDSAAAQRNLALTLEDAGDLDGAAAAYEASLSHAPDDAMTRANFGLLLLEQGQVERAKKQLQTALGQAGGDRATLLAIGNGLRRAGDAAGALQAMQAAVDSGSEPTAALLSELALAQRAAGDRDAAIATLERVLSMDARFAAAHYLLGNMLAGARRYGEARKHYREYLKLAPDGEQAERAKERLEMLAKMK